MAADGSIRIEIQGDAKNIEQALNQLNNQLNQTQSTAEDASSGLGKIDSSGTKAASGGLKAIATAAAAAYTSVAALATAAVKIGSEYETGMAQVATIMDTSVMSYDEMSSEIMALSNQTGQASTDLAESVYNAISATGDTANAVQLAADAAKLATAGFAEQADALSVLTTITNAYGMEVTEAETVSSSLIQTQRLGVTTVAQLSTSMGKAIATAAAYSIDLYNLEAAYVATTKAGISTEESTTYLSSMFKELGDSGSDVAGIIQDELGMSFGRAMDAGYSLGDVLQVLIDSVDGDTEALMNLWSSAEAGKAASAIAGQGIDAFNDNLVSLQDSAGSTESAYATMTDTLSYQMNLLKTRTQNLGTTLYDSFSGSITEAVATLADSMGSLIESIDDGELSDEVADISENISEFADKSVALATDALPAVIDGMAWLLDNFGTIVDIVETAAIGFGAYKTALLAVKAAEVVTTAASEGLAVALGANPVALIAGAAAGAAIALYNFADSALEAAGAFEQDSYSRAADNIAAISEAVDNQAASWEESRANSEATAAENASLMASLNSLVNAYDGSASAAAEINSVIDQLNSNVPGLDLNFDSLNGTLNLTSAEIEALVQQTQAYDDLMTAIENRDAAKTNFEQAGQAAADAQQAYNDALAALGQWNAENEGGYNYELQTNADEAAANLEAANAAASAAAGAYNNAQMAANSAAAAYDSYAESADGAADASDGAADSAEGAADSLSWMTDEQKSAQNAFSDIATAALEAGGSTEELQDAYNELKSHYDDLDPALSKYTAQTAEAALNQLELRATVSDLADEMGYIASVSGVDLTAVSQQLLDTGVTASEFASMVTGSLDDVVNGYEKYATDGYTTLSEAKSALQSNTDAQRQWTTDITTLWNQAVDSNDSAQMAYVQSLYDMGYDSNQIVADLVSGTGASLAEMATEYGEATSLAGEQAALNLAMQAGEIYDASQTAAQAAVDGAESVSAGESTGTDIDTQIATGITSSGELVSGAVETVATAAAAAFLNADWSGSGSGAASDIATGLSTGAGELTSAGTSIGNSAAAAIRAVSFNSVGKYIALGVAAGIRSGTSSVTSAAIAMVTAAKTAANSAAEIESPSKLFARDTGYWIPAGVAAGITQGTPVAEQAVEESMRNISAAAAAQTAPLVQSATSATTNSVNNYYSGSSSGGAYVVTIPVYLNGREIARASSQEVLDQYDFLHS